MTTTTIIPERLARVDDIRLKASSSSPNDKAMCVMEAVAYIAGEPWSDHPVCACPVITAFMISWNDALPNDAERHRLLTPLIPRLVGTRRNAKIEAKRAVMAADWYIRVQTPAWLRLAGLAAQADELAAFPEIKSFEKTPSLMPVLTAIRKDAEAAWSAARSAAWSAAWSAARSAAWSAAESAARSAAWSAAWSAAESAAESAARSAAESAAESAARSAAWSAARSAMADTTASLQDSAVDLVKRMCAVKR